MIACTWKDTEDIGQSLDRQHKPSSDFSAHPSILYPYTIIGGASSENIIGEIIGPTQQGSILVKSGIHFDYSLTL